MTEYNPDAWVLVKFNYKGGPRFSILAGWYGGFANGDVWRLSSGIERVELINNMYHVFNSSGSVYKCPKSLERFTGVTASIFNSWERDTSNNPGKQIKVTLIEMKDYYKPCSDNAIQK